MRIIYNSIVPVKGFQAINLFGVIFARKGKQLSASTLRHEAIHTAQMREMLYFFFYLFYVAGWISKLFSHGSDAYRNISFEREAYAHQDDENYLVTRIPFTWLKYL